MNDLYFSLILTEFNLLNPNTIYVEVNSEIDYITNTFVDEYSDLFLYSNIYKN